MPGRKTTDNTELFTTTPVPRAVLALAVPTVISQLITVAYNMADTFFVGQTGDPNQVAAATIATPAFILLTSLCNLFGIGGASVISRGLGAGDADRVRHASSFSAWAASAVALTYGVLIILFRPVILPLLGTDSGTYAFTSEYLFWTTGIGAIPTVLSTTLAHLIRAEGYSRQAGFGVAMGGILNIFLDPIFIFLLNLQLRGAAIATMLSNCAAMVYFLTWYFRNRHRLTIRLTPREFRLRGGLAAEVFTVGLPGFVISLLATVSNVALNNLMAGYSNAAVAGMGIAKKLDMAAFGIAQGMGQGVLPLVAYNYASGDRKRMKKSISTALLISLGVSLTVMVLLLLFAEPAVRSFIDDAATVSYGEYFVQVIAVAGPLMALNYMVITMFQATGRRLVPLILAPLRKGGVDVPLMLLFGAIWGVRGIPWATPAAELVGVTVGLCLFIPYWRKISAPGTAHEADPPDSAGEGDRGQMGTVEQPE